MIALFHLLGAIQFGYGVWYDIHYAWPQEVDPSQRNVLEKTKFLTFLNAILQTVYFAIAFLNDIVGGDGYYSAKKPFLRRIKDAIFCSLAFPQAMFVGSTFWGLYAIDRELVFPKSVDAFFPWWLNQIVHTNVVLFVLLELVINFRMYPSKRNGLMLMSIYMFSYIAWTWKLYFDTGVWAYPILEILNWPLKIAFNAVMICYTVFLYFIGDKFNTIVWSRQINKTLKVSKQRAL